MDYEELAELLQDIADNGADVFYSGDVADDIVAKVCASAVLRVNLSQYVNF